MHNAKDRYLKDFRAFVSNVEKNYSSYTTEDWKNKEAEFKQFTETKFNKNKKALTTEDKKAITKIVARFIAIRAKGYGKQLKDTLDDSINYIDGFLEGLNEKTN